MGSSNSSKLISYFLFLGFLFFVLYALDSFFGLKYEPEEHSINQSAKNHAISGHDHEAVLEDVHESETTESVEETPAEEHAEEEASHSH